MRGLILGLLLTAGLAGNANAEMVAGHYQVQGTNPDGSSYGGSAEITPHGDLCRIAWHVGSEWRGICMTSGNTFAATYHSGDTWGLLIYQLQPDGSLAGVWTLGDGSRGGTEKLIPEH